MKRAQENQLIEEVFTIGSLLIKFGFEHILEDQNLFIGFLNELGFKDTNGRSLTRPSMMTIFTRNNIKRIVESFTNEYRNYYILSELMIRDSTRQAM